MSFKADLACWNGRSAAIHSLYSRYHRHLSFVADLILLLEETSTQKGASWLLKKYLETGGSLESDQAKRIHELLPKLEHWETKLHLLQSLRFLSIPATRKRMVEKFLFHCVRHNNKFVRAWAYSGFHKLSQQHPEYLRQARNLMAEAMKNEAASVRARIRRITVNRRNLT